MNEAKKKKFKRRIKEEPIYFMERVLGVTTLQEYQKKVLRSIKQYSKVAIAATHSISKTYTLGRVVLWFLFTHRRSVVVTTAPTYRQVVKLLWGEIADAYKNAKIPLGGRLTTNELKINEKWYAIGFSPKDEAGSAGKEQKGSTLQGFHGDSILVVIDEATGVKPDTWKMIEGIMTSGAIVKLVAIANPTTRNCKFFECFSDPEFHKMYLSCFDSPNLIANGFTDKEKFRDEIEYLRTLNDEDRLKRIEGYAKPVPYLLSAQWAISRVYKWGMEHPLSLSKVFGEFPIDDDNVIVPFSFIEKAINRQVEENALDTRFIGLDVARYGSDLSVITEMKGYVETGMKAMSKRDTNHVSGKLIRWILDGDYGQETIVCIDEGGLGSGPVDNLIAAQKDGTLPPNVEIVGVNFGAACESEDEAEDYANLVSFMFDKLKYDLRDHIKLLDESVYREELSDRLYRITDKGKLQIESKDDFKKRTGKGSPDHADSLALANYGRYARLKIGSFKGHAQGNQSKPYRKRDRERERESSEGFSKVAGRIKMREY